MPSLARLGFQNQASGAVVTGGRWEFCSSPEGRGDCVVLEPGRYERLDQKVYHRMEERVSSLIVHDGVWQLCTRPGYEGRCRTFEPGQYPSLERMDDRVASLRQMR